MSQPSRKTADTITDDELDQLYTERDFIRRVLAVFSEADAHADLLWHVDGHEIRFSANVSDVFFWGAADAESITVARLPVLEQALVDLKAVDAAEFTAELYAARIRGERPQGAAYPSQAYTGWRGVAALFDACGPERATGLGNPRQQGGRRPR